MYNQWLGNIIISEIFEGATSWKFPQLLILEIFENSTSLKWSQPLVLEISRITFIKREQPLI